jgi:hypothetical protein
VNLPTLRRRALTPGPVLIPATPTTVVAELLARYTTVHDLRPAATTTVCGLALWPFWQLSLAQARWSYDPHFCDRCWPGHRCVLCGVPSGQADECRRCLIDDVEREKRLAA